MLRRLLVVGLAWACFGVPAARAGTVAIFYYPWYGTPAQDGSWQHWSQNGHRAADGPLLARTTRRAGAYSSSTPCRRRGADGRAEGGRTSTRSSSRGGGAAPARTRRLPLVARAARAARPAGRRPSRAVRRVARRPTIAGRPRVHRLARRPRRLRLPPARPAASPTGPRCFRPRPPPLRVFAGTDDVGVAVHGGFDGFYTYDFVTYGAAKFRRLCTEAHRARHPLRAVGRARLRRHPRRRGARRRRAGAAGRPTTCSGGRRSRRRRTT